jgi:APA family basic amino acid/polyamine antiporter
VDRWWYPLAPIVFIAGCGLLALMLLLHALGPSLLGAAIVLAGLPVRWLLLRKTNLTPAVAAESPLELRTDN